MAALVFIGHEASLTGAPYTQLYLLRWLRANTSHTVELILLHGGPLVEEFVKVANVYVVHKPVTDNSFSRRVLQKANRVLVDPIKKVLRIIAQKKPELIFANASLSLELGVRAKQQLRVPLLLHVHELDTTFFYLDASLFAQRATAVDLFIPCSQAVKQFYHQRFAIPEDKMQVIYEYVGSRESDQSTAISVRQELGLTADTPLIGAVGTVGWRKGSDWFLEVVRQFQVMGREEVRFVWLGANPTSREYKELLLDVTRLGLSTQLTIVPARNDVRGFYEAFNVLLLPSREDPFPLVCLEAATQGCPTICFEQAGGMPEFVRDDAGVVVPYGDTLSMAQRACQLLDQPVARRKLGQVAQQRVQAECTIEVAGPQFSSIVQQLLTPHLV